MEIRILEEFVCLVETCNFQETATIMNVSQSSLSKHIRKLEEDLNITLFDRSARSVRLNEYSRLLYPYAKQIVSINQTVTPEDLKDENFILHASATSRPHEETQNFLNLCAQMHFEPHIVTEPQFSSTMVRYVLTGRGIAVLNRLHIPSEMAEECSIVDIYPTTRSYIYLMYRRRLSGPVATEFLHFIIEKMASA